MTSHLSTLKVKSLVMPHPNTEIPNLTFSIIIFEENLTKCWLRALLLLRFY